MDDQEAAHYIDRFASSAPQDSEFDPHALSSATTEYLGKLPDSQFQQAAQNAYASASPAQQQGLMGSLMRALQNRGVDLGSILGGAGVASRQMTPDQYAQAANYARQQHPEAIKEVVREQPWLIKAMGNPVVMGALGMVASRMIKSRTQASSSAVAEPNAPAHSSGGLLGRLF